MFKNKEIIIKFNFILLFLLLPFPVFAQTASQDLRLTTSPAPINLKASPNSSLSVPLKIKNDGLNNEKIKVSLLKFKADSQTGNPLLLEREAGDEYFDWIKFSENAFTLNPNEWKIINAEFNIPSSASFGYYYAVVFSRDEESILPQSRQTILTGGAAILILLEVEVPHAKKEVQLLEFSADKKMYEFLPAIFSVKLRNTGNVHVAPRGNIFLINRQKQIASLEINSNKGSILPNSPRQFQEIWQDGFPIYIHNDNQAKKLHWDFKDAAKLRFGRYTAKLIMVYDDGQKDIPLEAEVSFWVVPWRIIFGTFGVLILFFLAGRFSNKISFGRKK